ncbi:MAG: hypothetical protein M0004_17150 [Actinomycetota bacterium]|nr:hypothetical protein [Actinomycetota bacterium]
MHARRLVITALMGATAFPLAGAVTEALPAPPAGAAIARPVWTHHAATLPAGRHLVVTLRRTRPSVCTLRVSGPKHAARHWTYASGSGLIQFDLAASPAVTPGVWTLVATCVPHGTRAVERVSTTVRVLGHKAGWASLVGARGPLYQVPVGSGLVTKPTPGSATLTVDPTLGGRGGDPATGPAAWCRLPTTGWATQSGAAADGRQSPVPPRAKAHDTWRTR